MEHKPAIKNDIVYMPILRPILPIYLDMERLPR